MKRDIQTNHERLLTEDEEEMIWFMGRHCVGRVMRASFQHRDSMDVQTARDLVDKGVFMFRKSHFIFTDFAWEIYDHLEEEYEKERLLKTENLAD